MISARPVKNSSRLRQAESSEYAPATRSGSRVFHASSAAWTFCRAVSSVKGGSGGRGAIGITLLSWVGNDSTGGPAGLHVPQPPVQQRRGPDHDEQPGDGEAGDVDVEVGYRVPEGAVQVDLGGQHAEDLDRADDERRAD